MGDHLVEIKETAKKDHLINEIIKESESMTVVVLVSGHY